MRERFEDALDAARELWDRTPPKVRKGAALAAASVVLYVATAAFISQVVLPPSGPPASDAPRAGMMLVDRELETTVILRRTTADTDGAFVEVDMVIEGGGGAGQQGSHVHPGVDERLVVLEGTIVVDVEGEPMAVAAGQQLEIPRGVAHGIRNSSDRAAVLRGRFEPALHVDSYLVQVDRAGGFGSAGRIRLAVLSTYFEQQYPGALPVWVSKSVALLMAPTARLMGVPTYYPPS